MGLGREIIVFICGACVMVMELVGSRLMAPYLGTSLFVWTSLIGVILGCLSLGYWVGGILADKRPEPKVFSGILLLSGITIALVALAGDPVLFFVQSLFTDVRISAVLATVILFGIPSVLLGMVSPFAVKLKLSDIHKTGSAAGTLYALSTLGSIVGTFLAGFFLMSFFSHRAILFGISLALIALSPLAAGRRRNIQAVLAFIAVLGSSFTEPFVQSVMGQGFHEVHTAYNRAWIYDAYMEGRPVRVMQLNDTGDSAMFLESDELAFDYTRFFRLAGHFRPDLKKTLMIGGGAYSYPKYFLKEFPEGTMDVVEIDPELTEISRKWFGLKEDPRLRIFHEDARTYLNRTTDRYDVVYGDVYKSYSVPFHLATVEAIQKISDAMTDDGVFVMNVISAAEGGQGRFLHAMLATLDQVFPQTFVFAVARPEDALQAQNFMVVSFKTKARRSFVSADPAINRMLAHVWPAPIARDLPALTDHYAPVEDYLTEVITEHPERKTSFLHRKYAEKRSQRAALQSPSK